MKITFSHIAYLFSRIGSGVLGPRWFRYLCDLNLTGCGFAQRTRGEITRRNFAASLARDPQRMCLQINAVLDLWQMFRAWVILLCNPSLLKTWVNVSDSHLPGLPFSSPSLISRLANSPNSLYRESNLVALFSPCLPLASFFLLRSSFTPSRAAQQGWLPAVICHSERARHRGAQNVSNFHGKLWPQALPRTF